ncbi:methyltransferase domain-containing protein [Umezawaea beigongshangensis]|uniref:methyltransferase domain-containing protein n=1 Tax=Umezawaea beigongshangensis TaxID=2780383 RepID=UPI0018F2682E|nr:methyltransferase domain-containing protein [Umezawaea beigongshangensis]
MPRWSGLDARAGRLRKRLASALLADGAVRDPRWLDAFRTVPRHVFLRRFLLQRPDGLWEAADSSRPDWLELVYDDQVRVTQLDGDPESWERARAHGGVPGEATCSSSMPAIMAIMLEALRVRDGHDVLEIGTGTGYNAALLGHVLGDEHVTTVDVDRSIAALAGENLAAAGHAPTVVTGDGLLGVPGRAPFDRVLGTCAVTRVPLPWLEQTTPGGLVVTTLNRLIGAGLVRITAGDGPCGEGRVLREDGRFMPLRAHARHWTAAALEHAGTAEAVSRRETDLPVNAVLAASHPFEFFAGLVLADVAGCRVERGGARFAHEDGSWVRHTTRDGTSRVEQGGPRALWDLAEAAHEHWLALGSPRRDRFGVTVGPDGQRFWLDAPTSEHSWPL